MQFGRTVHTRGGLYHLCLYNLDEKHGSITPFGQLYNLIEKNPERLIFVDNSDTRNETNDRRVSCDRFGSYICSMHAHPTFHRGWKGPFNYFQLYFLIARVNYLNITRYLRSNKVKIMEF